MDLLFIVGPQLLASILVVKYWFEEKQSLKEFNEMLQWMLKYFPSHTGICKLIKPVYFYYANISLPKVICCGCALVSVLVTDSIQVSSILTWVLSNFLSFNKNLLKWRGYIIRRGILKFWNRLWKLLRNI